MLAFSYGFSNRMAVAILRLGNGLDMSINAANTTPPNELTTPSSSVTNFRHLEHGNNSRRELLHSNSNGTAANIMHADSYLNISKLPSQNSNCKQMPGWINDLCRMDNLEIVLKIELLYNVYSENCHRSCDKCG